jgi:phytoene synthase
MATELQTAYQYCQQVAREHAKNFYYAFRTLPSEKRQAIYAAYAFCRLCDDIADEEQPVEDKMTRFAETRDLLAKSFHEVPNDPIFTALKDAIDTFHIPQSYFEEVIDGVEMDLDITRFQTFDNLREYCYKVASVVGLVCIEVFGYNDPKAREYAIDLGIAMQLTNILRDVREDAERGRIYIPLEEIEQFGYSEHELMNGIVNDAFRELMSYQAQRAREYFARGKLLIPMVSPESRPCLGVLHGVYSSVLDRIEESGYNVFERRIGLSAGEKVFLMLRLWATSRIPFLSA